MEKETWVANDPSYPLQTSVQNLGHFVHVFSQRHHFDAFVYRTHTSGIKMQQHDGSVNANSWEDSYPYLICHK